LSELAKARCSGQVVNIFFYKNPEKTTVKIENGFWQKPFILTVFLAQKHVFFKNKFVFISLLNIVVFENVLYSNVKIARISLGTEHFLSF